MTRSGTLRTAVSSLALASLLLAAPFTPRLGDVLTRHGLGAAAMAKEGGDDSGGDDHGGEHGGGHDSSDDGGDDGGGDSGSDSGGSDDGGSGHSGSDDGGSDDHGSGGHGADDGAAHDASDDHGGRRHRDGQAAGGTNTTTAGRDVARIERSARGIEVTYADGWSEELEGGRYELKDARHRTVVERPATSADLARLQALLP